MNSKFTSLTRNLLGLLLIILGSNEFWPFMPISHSQGSTSILHSLTAAGYFFPIVGVLEILVGTMLLIKKWDAFALILMAPISASILLFHVFFELPGLEMAIAVATLNGILIYKNRTMYSSLFI